MTRMIGNLVCSTLCALMLLSCSSDLIRNPLVERWCGDTPCDWQVKGEIERVGTWHPNDYGVSLVGDDAALIQDNGVVDYRDSDCFSFAMVAKIAAGVKVFLELDFLADGSVEFSQRLPVSDWERRTFLISAPTWYRKVRFIIRKEGPGRAVVAEISAQNADGQCSAPPVVLSELPQGALCSADDDCTPGLSCGSGRCGGCTDDASCRDGSICALGQVGDERYKICTPRADAPLGAACSRDDQCQTGVCSDGGACSECATAADCDGSACELARQRPGNARFWPQLCGVAGGEREAGEACSDGSDCASGECLGFEVSCEVQRSCDGSDGSCFLCAPDLQLGTCS